MMEISKLKLKDPWPVHRLIVDSCHQPTSDLELRDLSVLFLLFSSPQVRHPVFSFPGALEGGNRSQAVGLDAGVNDEGIFKSYI